MSNSPHSDGGLLNEFRRRIGDTAYTYVQCEISCDDETATVATLEVTDSHLITTVADSDSATALNLDLQQPEYGTIERLVHYINGLDGYAARVASDGEGIHVSDDLEIIAPKDILRRFVQLKSRRWSDSELEDFLLRAISKLSRDTNKKFDIVTMPSKMRDMLFLLATLGVYWDQINNATKRRGLDLSVDEFRSLHQAILDEYERALKSYLAQQAEAESEELEETGGSGDIILGTQYRRNLRTGRLTPSALSPFPPAATLSAGFIGGGKIQVVWTPVRMFNFHHYELWRGTTADLSNLSEVSRPVGAIAPTGVKITSEYAPERTLWVDGGTSPLPPGTYYYRLYTYNNNGQYMSSVNIAQATVV